MAQEILKGVELLDLDSFFNNNRDSYSIGRVTFDRDFR